MAQYLPLLVLLILASLFAGLSFVASALLGQRRRPTAAKVAPYECGIVPDDKSAERFPVRFYLVAMIFIIFDIEIIFLYPWAVILRDLGAFGLWEMLAFAAAVFVSFVYLLGRGALNWGPAKHVAPERLTEAGAPPTATAGVRSGERSTESTIRRVGGDGRAPVRAGAGSGASKGN
ncbi:MAG TPA: NADH-quinone oxidoreductase subunit A [Acidimicrobiales bacterium]|nr:NADH-quinone oxidoreductase subunit A [Acidimicrobiales bacterium]